MISRYLVITADLLIMYVFTSSDAYIHYKERRCGFHDSGIQVSIKTEARFPSHRNVGFLSPELGCKTVRNTQHLRGEAETDRSVEICLYPDADSGKISWLSEAGLGGGSR